ncbi:hypothetical protein L2744_09430 [Shewanella profunda]|uniref:hypothetical protein n=1 Tax=Shewanella profunda TaxID=254793 RepID=UPI00200C0AE8|nr:hypothetical protein [Shewanella profunda]MCL1089825.1 hypothetical protein [Shewanella profunda]
MSVLSWFKKCVNLIKSSKQDAALPRVFSQMQMPDITIPKQQAYPLVTPMVQGDIYAYQIHCLLTLKGKQAIDALITNAGFEALPEHTTHFDGLIKHSNQSTSLFLNQYADFAGVCMNLITNDQALLEQLISFKSALPHPWESFPDIAPDTLGSLQGNIDFWCHYFWHPYWLSLSQSERLQYPESWREFSEFH